MNKELRKLIAELEDQGWRIEDRRHIVAFPPSKEHGPVVIAKTASDHRSMKNTLAELRKRGFEG